MTDSEPGIRTTALLDPIRQAMLARNAEVGALHSGVKRAMATEPSDPGPLPSWGFLSFRSLYNRAEHGQDNPDPCLWPDLSPTSDMTFIHEISTPGLAVDRGYQVQYNYGHCSPGA